MNPPQVYITFLKNLQQMTLEYILPNKSHSAALTTYHLLCETKKYLLDNYFSQWLRLKLISVDEFWNTKFRQWWYKGRERKNICEVEFFLEA